MYILICAANGAQLLILPAVESDPKLPSRALNILYHQHHQLGAPSAAICSCMKWMSTWRHELGNTLHSRQQLAPVPLEATHFFTSEVHTRKTTGSRRGGARAAAAAAVQAAV
jgi:hypothetical protein